VQLYDFAPVGYLTVDRATALQELNLTAAGMLGSERDKLLGHALDAFLEPRSALALRAMLDRLSDGGPREVRALQLVAAHGGPRDVLTSATRDPDGQHFLVAFINSPGHESL
jgi:PAS domain-containing protein